MGKVLIQLNDETHSLAKRLAGSEGMYLKHWLSKQLDLIVFVKKKNLNNVKEEKNEA